MSRMVGWWRMAGALNGPSLVTVLTAFFVTLAHAEDAGEAVRTSAQFGKSKSLGTYDTICRTMVRSASDISLLHGDAGKRVVVSRSGRNRSQHE